MNSSELLSNPPRFVVLVDDDALIQVAWRIHCRIAGVGFHAFSSVQSAAQSEQVQMLPRESSTWIVVDSEFGGGAPRGEVSSRVFHEMGFESIWIATGHLPEDIQTPFWVVGVRGKEPWF